MKDILEKIKKDKIIQLIKKHSQNTEIYLVGGVIRDFYLNKENFDKDIVIANSNPEKFAKMIAENLKASFIPLDEENKIYRLVLKDKINFIDIAGIIGNNIEDDLKRRDLAINSIAINLQTLEILDFNNGINDLKAKKIKHIREENFVDDPLRLLRSFRFQAALGFELDAELIKITKKHAKKIHSSSVERINYELLKLFGGKYSEKALLNMDLAGLLEEILPVIKELKKVPSNLHHHLDLFNHSIEIVKQIQEIYEKSSLEVKFHLDKIDFGGESRLAHLKFSGLLHDIGKPETWSIEEETGRHRFIKHDDIGAKTCTKMLKAAKFSKKQINYITKMIKHHIYPSHVVTAPEINDKIYMRFIRKMQDEAIDVIVLAMADRLSARGVEITEEVVQKNITSLQSLLDFYLNIKDSLEPLPKLLSGEEIMELLNLKPSKELGDIIKKLKEAQLSGDVTTKEEAVEFVNGKW